MSPESVMSHNDTLCPAGGMLEWPQPPACHAVTAKKYRRTEGLTNAQIFARHGLYDRDGSLHRLVTRILMRHGPADLVERYLLDAVYRWMLVRCRTAASRASYLYSFRDFVLWTVLGNPDGSSRQRRTLDRVLRTPTRELENYVMHQEHARAAQRTGRHRLAVLSGFFGWAYDREHIRRNPITRDMFKRCRVDEVAVVRTKVRTTLTQGEAQQLVTWAFQGDTNRKAALSVLLQVTSGLRSQEVADLDKTDLRFHEPSQEWQLIVAGKGQKTRLVRVEPVAVQAKERLYASHRLKGTRGALIPRPDGSHHTARQVQRWAKLAAEAVGRGHDISSHALRRSCANLWRWHGADLEQVRAQLGHASIKTTQQCYVTEPPPMEATTGLSLEEQNHG